MREQLEEEQNQKLVTPQFKEIKIKPNKIRKWKFSKDKVKTFIMFLLVLIIIYQIYQKNALQAQIRQMLQTQTQLKFFQADQQNCICSSHYKKVQQKEKYNFQRMLGQYLIPFTKTNCKIRRYGNKKDGGYLLCENLIKQSSILLNFGISDDDTFGCALSTVHRIANYQFDCTMTSPYSCPNNQTFFNKICLSNENKLINDRRYSTYESIIAKIKFAHQDGIILKIDIEGNQWTTLPQISQQQLQRIDQIVIEFHLNYATELGVSWHYLSIIKQLTKRFIPVNLHMNNFGCFGIYKNSHYLGSNSFQVTLVNRKLIQFHNFQQSFSTSNQNAPNQPDFYDCQMK